MLGEDSTLVGPQEWAVQVINASQPLVCLVFTGPWGADGVKRSKSHTRPGRCLLTLEAMDFPLAQLPSSRGKTASVFAR